MVNDLIYDIGMNNGDDTAYYLNLGYRVIAIEANPILVEEASKRFQNEIAQNRLKILKVGIARENGSFDFWICDDHDEWSSFHKSVASRNGAQHHAIQIPCRTFASVIDEFGSPIYLKVDIEGNDVLCLAGLIDRELPKYLSCEGTSPDLVQQLAALGYNRFKCISQLRFLPLELPPPKVVRDYERMLQILESKRLPIRIARKLGLRKIIHNKILNHRRNHGWTFPLGSSGPFGENTHGRWLTAKEMTETCTTYRRYRDERKPSIFWNNENYSFWCDFHCKVD